MELHVPHSVDSTTHGITITKQVISLVTHMRYSLRRSQCPSDPCQSQ